MAMSATQIEQLIANSLPGAVIRVEKLSDDGEHYAVHVTAKEFIGKSRIAQHKMVYEAMGGHMGSDLHAMALQTSPPKEE